MLIPISARLTNGAGRSVTRALPSVCPRVRWRSVNPALPPPESLTCFARGPDCCTVSAMTGVRRVA
jgi:hypothetical protein